MIPPGGPDADAIPTTLRDPSLLSPVRQRIIDMALGYVGCGATKDHDRYMDLVCGPGDMDAQMRRALEGASGCALVARGLLRKVGCTAPVLLDRYRIGHAMSDLEMVGRDADCWVDARHAEGALPRPGDIVVLSSPTGGHAFTIVELRLGERTTLDSVDGGQRDAQGAQQILRFARWWSTIEGLLVDHAYSTRYVRGWIDVDGLGVG